MNNTDNNDASLAARYSLLAWAGWQMQIPREWHPLKLEGNQQKGRMIVGDSECAILILHWERPRRGDMPKGAQWVAGRLKKHGILPQDDPPAREHFTACGWAQGVQSEEEKKTTYWYGCSRPARLLLGITVNGVLPAHILRKAIRKVLPSLRAIPVSEESLWAMYDVSFRAPAGYELAQRHLFSGDIALEFAKGRQETLMLRQVYPGELALARRPREKWLESYPFKEHRKIRTSTIRTRKWDNHSRSELSGTQRTGWKRLPAPLGWCAPRQTRSLAVLDGKLNRLLLAEHMAKKEPDARMCAKAIEDMNEDSRMRNRESGTRN